MAFAGAGSVVVVLARAVAVAEEEAAGVAGVFSVTIEGAAPGTGFPVTVEEEEEAEAAEAFFFSSFSSRSWYHLLTY